MRISDWSSDVCSSDLGSPLAAITRAQAQALQAHMGDDLLVDWAMRYGNPSIESRLLSLTEGGCDRILIAPLYPQYCAATTARVQDEVYRVLGTLISEEHTSELQSLMRISYAVFCLKKQTNNINN